MKERPILFSGAMVRAILEGRKTQTRRVIKPIQPRADGMWPAGRNPLEDSKYGQPGDRLWVRETWAPVDFMETGYTLESPVSIGYAADQTAISHESDNVHALDTHAWNWAKVRWRPSIHMPRWASRLTLEVTEVRVQRLEEISEEDARAEGVEPVVYEHWTAYDPETEGYPSFGVEPDAEMIARKRLENVRHHGPKVLSTARQQFERLWQSINGKRPGCSWESNPWVWCVSFRRIHDPTLPPLPLEPAVRPGLLRGSVARYNGKPTAALETWAEICEMRRTQAQEDLTSNPVL